MSDQERSAPIPVLLVGDEARATEAALSAGLAASGQSGRFSCAAFDGVDSAADASSGARQIVLIALGPDSEEILTDPVWLAWSRPGVSMARIAMSDETSSADLGMPVPNVKKKITPNSPQGTRDGADESDQIIYRLPSSQADALPMATIVVAQLLDAARNEKALQEQLDTERACEPLAACLEPGKLYPMALELLLERLGCQRGIAFFSPSPAGREAGVAARGFPEEVRDRLSRMLIDEKSLESTMGQGEVGVVPWGPLHHALGQLGLDSPGPLLSVPLRGDDREAGHVWILSEGQRFDSEDLESATTIARRVNAALTTAEQYHRAKERAFIDDVTGVYNARYLLATADNEIQRADRYGNPLSVLFLDLDRFKQVNDVHGHLVGSDTLRTLSALLGQSVRQVDTLARYGGDEFTVLLVDTPHDVALRVAERIRSRVEGHIFEAGREGSFRLSISIGVATCPEHGTSREPLLDAADKAMYRAKSQGRNRVCSANDLGSEPENEPSDEAPGEDGGR